jgi:hypothetical protein
VIVIVVSLLLAGVWLIPGARVAENRGHHFFPDVSRAGLASSADFRAIDAALLDRLGVRGTVIDELAAGLVGAGLSPNAEVFRGPSGEPFVSTDFTYTCYSRPQVEAVDTISRYLRAVLADRHIDVLYAVAPDKSSIERDALGPAADLIMTCADANRATLQGFADAADSPLLVGWDELAALPGSAYMFDDTHWTQQAAAVYAGLLIDRLGADGVAPPGLFDPADVVERGTVAYDNDVLGLMGVDAPESVARLVSERPGVVTTRDAEKHDGVTTRRWTSTGPDLIDGRTLVLHDSFFEVNREVLAPYFADLTALPLSSIGEPGTLASLDGYDHVIILQVQRFVPSFVGDIPTAAWITAGR